MMTKQSKNYQNFSTNVPASKFPDTCYQVLNLVYLVLHTCIPCALLSIARRRWRHVAESVTVSPSIGLSVIMPAYIHSGAHSSVLYVSLRCILATRGIRAGSTRRVGKCRDEEGDAWSDRGVVMAIVVVVVDEAGYCRGVTDQSESWGTTRKGAETTVCLQTLSVFLSPSFLPQLARTRGKKKGRRAGNHESNLGPKRDDRVHGSCLWLLSTQRLRDYITACPVSFKKENLPPWLSAASMQYIRGGNSASFSRLSSASKTRSLSHFVSLSHPIDVASFRHDPCWRPIQRG